MFKTTGKKNPQTEKLPTNESQEAVLCIYDLTACIISLILNNSHFHSDNSSSQFCVTENKIEQAIKDHSSWLNNEL